MRCAAKTGTAQVKENIDNYYRTYDNGILITYAPADNPQIAIAQVIERADSGSSTAEVAASIYKYYFAKNHTATDSSDKTNNSLLG